MQRFMDYFRSILLTADQDQCPHLCKKDVMDKILVLKNRIIDFVAIFWLVQLPLSNE